MRVKRYQDFLTYNPLPVHGQSDFLSWKKKVETQKVTYIGSSKLRIFIHSFANIKEPGLMDDVCVRLTLFNGNGEPKESVNCFPNKEHYISTYIAICSIQGCGRLQ